MNKIIDKIKNVHLNVHYLDSRKKYTIGFYTGGVKLSDWNSISKENQNKALLKDWYIRWSYRNPKTHKLIRQNNIKAGVNYYKSKSDRLQVLNVFKQNLILLLDGGYSPFNKEIENISNNKSYTSNEALDYVLNLKKSSVSNRTYKDYFYETEKFKKFLKKHLLLKSDINKVTKNVIVKYLNEVLKDSSARTRNNARSNLSSLFTLMKDNFIIESNFIKTDVSKLTSLGKTDRTISNELLNKISKHLQSENPTLLLYVKFVAYNFLRPVEVNRLIIKNIDLKEKRIYFKAKNKQNFKIKRIPDILVYELLKLDLSKYSPNDFLFTPKGIPGQWNRDDNGRRDYFTGKFKDVVKDKFKLGSEYGIYSFRHTYITNLFRTFRLKMTFNTAIDTLMPITGHSSKEGLINYIHKIDADIPKDWSSDIEIIL